MPYQVDHALGFDVSLVVSAAAGVVYGLAYYLWFSRGSDPRRLVKAPLAAALTAVIVWPVVYSVANFIAMFGREQVDFAEFISREFDSDYLILRANTVVMVFPIYAVAVAVTRLARFDGDYPWRRRAVRGLVSTTVFQRSIDVICLVGIAFPISVAFIWATKFEARESLYISVLNILTFLLIDDFVIARHFLIASRGRVPTWRLMLIVAVAPVLCTLCVIGAFVVDLPRFGIAWIVLDAIVIFGAIRAARSSRRLYSHLRLALQDERYALESAADALAALADRHRGSYDAVVGAAGLYADDPPALRRAIRKLAMTLRPRERIYFEDLDRDLTAREKRLTDSSD